jgi:hypothetical protein
MSIGIERFRQRQLARSVAMIIAITAAGHVTTSHAGALSDAIDDIKPILDLRMRVESVDQEPLAEESEVTTLRMRLGFETGKVLQTALLIEGEGVLPIDGEYRPDSAVPSHLTHPIVPDPEGYERDQSAAAHQYPAAADAADAGAPAHHAG